jgi:prepilin-type N-terminal cleavage/methylation domain-containing protein
MSRKPLQIPRPQGFSLVEMAVVLVILGFVIGALLLPLQAQREQLSRNQTQNQLEIARKALIGFAQSNGRLPCPATAVSNIDSGSNGIEQPVGGGACTTQMGYLPAATLGVQPTDTNGFAIDAWNNRILYAVAQNSAATTPVNPATPDYTIVIADDPTTTATNEADGMSAVGIANLTPELRVCNSGLLTTGITASTCSGSPETNYSINNAVAVIYSLGPTGSLPAGGIDEAENPSLQSNPQRVFVSHGITSNNEPGGEFDHLVVWISPYVLYNAMIQAGQLH